MGNNIVKALGVLMIMVGSATSASASNIPAEHFAKNPQFEQMRISPDGKFLAASLVTETGEPRVTVIDMQTKKLVSMTNFLRDEEPGRIVWLNDERFGFFLLDKPGSADYSVNTGKFVTMNADGKKRKLLWNPRDRGYAWMRISNLLEDDDRHILITESKYARGREAAPTRVMKLNIYNGRAKREGVAPIGGASLLSDLDGNVRFASGADPKDSNKVLLYYRDNEDDDWSLFETFNVKKGGISPLSFTADGKSVYAINNMDDPLGSLVKFNLDTKQQDVIYQNERVTIDRTVFNSQGELLGVRTSPDFTYTRPVSDHPDARWINALQATFKGKTVDITSATRDNQKMVVAVSSASAPTNFYLFDAKNTKIEHIASTMPWMEKHKFGTVEPFKMTARDGTEMFGYLTLPPGVSYEKAKDLPMIVHPHGGPHGPRDYWQFNPEVQFLASRGYAVLQLNFRGSGGYGREFMYSGYGKWGAEMQDDLTDATHWAINNGIADKDRICIYGASYGGYASLMGVTKEPDLYQCAVGYVGVYSLPMMFDEGDIQDRRSGRQYLKEALGDDEQLLKARSPAYNVDKLKAAIFLVHGAKDVRVPIEQAYFLRDELEKIDYPYEWMVKENEAHGFRDEDNKVELYNRLESFFAKHIGE